LAGGSVFSALALIVMDSVEQVTVQRELAPYLRGLLSAFLRWLGDFYICSVFSRDSAAKMPDIAAGATPYPGYVVCPA